MASVHSELMTDSLWRLISCSLVPLVFFHATTPLFASQCSAIRLDQSGSMRHVDVLNQGDSLCHSYVLAQMIDAWRFSHGPQPPAEGYRFRTSALELATGYATFIRNGVFQPASLYDVGAYLRKSDRGVCDSRVLARDPSNDKPDVAFANQLLDYWKKFSNYLNDKENLEAVLQKSEGKAIAGRPFGPLDLLLTGSFDAAKGLKCDVLRDDPVGIAALMKLVRENNPVDYLNGVLSAICEGHRVRLKIPSMVEKYFPPNSQDPLAREVVKLISAPNAQPVAIYYCINVMFLPGYRGYGQEPFAKDCVPHFALVIGQRINPSTGRCQLLVQNTAGSKCEIPYSKDWECDHGKYWMDQESLLSNVRNIEYFPL